MSSPTQRTLKKLRDDGWAPWVVEKYIPATRRRLDLWNCLDLVAIRGTETLGVQACARSSVSARVRKIAENEYIGRIREAGWRVEVWGWGKMANGRWQCRVVDCS